MCVCKVQFKLEHAMKAHKGSRGMAVFFFLNSAVDGVGGQRHTRPLYVLGEGPGAHCIGGLVGSRTGLDGCVKFRLYRDSIPGTSSP